MDQIKNLILDMDGVLWHGMTPLPGLPDFFEKIGLLGLNWVFATNNSSKTREQYVEKFAGMGVSINPAQVMTSAVATAHYMLDNFPVKNDVTENKRANVYVLGGDGLHQALADVGFNVLASDDYLTPAEAVVVGLNQAFTYEDVSIATIQIRNHGATLIASNADSTYPTERGLLPGAGALVAMVQTATDQKAIVVGKPYPIMYQQALKLLGDKATLYNTAMVGDRLNTDVAGAIGVGMRSVLVMSGVTQPADLETTTLKPDFIVSGITALAAELEKHQGLRSKG
ncbi:MAG: 4-nitrophenyl phosphatase [Cellvibrionaceae bacterium]|jgi:4-nitrophenyl phosphatase